MLAEALAAEVDAYIARFAGERDDHGRRLRLRPAATWLWAAQLTAAITHLQALAPG